MNRKLILGALIGAAAVVSLPSAANAATCTYTDATKTMDVRYRAGESSVTVKPGASLQYSDGGLLRSCFSSTTGKAATPTNTAKLIIKGPTGLNAQSQTTFLDETGAAFADLNPALDLSVLTGTNDRLVLKKGARKDSVRLMEQTEGLAFGPLIDLNYDGNTDVRMTTNNTTVEVDAGAGDDLVDATSVLTYNTDQLGEAGNDVLVGGAKKDALFGLAGNDVLFSNGDAGQNDLVQGGEGTDRGKVDFGFDTFGGIEQFNL